MGEHNAMMSVQLIVLDRHRGRCEERGLSCWLLGVTLLCARGFPGFAFVCFVLRFSGLRPSFVVWYHSKVLPQLTRPNTSDPPESEELPDASGGSSALKRTPCCRKRAPET
eukprot:768726-Hanusia_phi.AAC.1